MTNYEPSTPLVLCMITKVYHLAHELVLRGGREASVIECDIELVSFSINNY